MFLDLNMKKDEDNCFIRRNQEGFQN